MNRSSKIQFMSTFQDLGLSEALLRSLKTMGYTNPTEIQNIAIPQILSSKSDLKAFAQTGTGKTAAFSLPILDQLNLKNDKTQAIVLSPTRELAIQIARNMQEFGQDMDVLKVMAVYGGANIEEQIRELRKGVHVVVGTPGRTLDLINRKVLNLSSIRWLVLDEADEMLNMGFKEELDSILETTPANKQTLLFSATFPKEVEAIASNYMYEPVEISAGKKNVGAVSVEHEYYLVTDRNRYPALKRVADINPDIYSIVFCRTRREAKDIADKLIADGYNADALHGDLSQAQRDLVMQKFRTGHLQILVATDVAARGLDVNDLTHVINYKLPDQIENYTHRSGRTGRAGKTGVSVSIITAKEKNKLHPIEKKIQRKFVQKPVPGGREICERQLFHLIDKVHDIEINEKEIRDFLPDIYSKLEGLERDELIKRFVSIEFNQFLSYYQNAADLNKEEKAEKRNLNEDYFTRFYISLGSMDNLTPARLIGLINEYLKKRDTEIGRIEILKSFSFFEIESQYREDVLLLLNDAEFNGRRVIVEVTEKQKSKKSGNAPNWRRSEKDRRFDKKSAKGKKKKSKKQSKGRGRNKW